MSEWEEFVTSAHAAYTSGRYVEALTGYQLALECIVESINQSDDQSTEHSIDSSFTQIITDLRFRRAAAFKALNQYHLALTEVITPFVVHRNKCQSATEQTIQLVNRLIDHLVIPPLDWSIDQLRDALSFAYQCDQRSLFLDVFQYVINQPSQATDHSTCQSNVQVSDWIVDMKALFPKYLAGVSDQPDQGIGDMNEHIDRLRKASVTASCSTDQPKTHNKADSTNQLKSRVKLTESQKRHRDEVHAIASSANYVYQFSLTNQSNYLESIGLLDQVIHAAISRSFEHVAIAPSEIHRLGVFAKQPIEQGVDCLVESPAFSCSVDGDRCDWCCRLIDQSIDHLMCVDCKQESYCSDQCRNQAYHFYHRHACTQHWPVRALKHSIKELGYTGSSRNPLLVIKMLSRSFNQSNRLTNIWESNRSILSLSAPDNQVFVLDLQLPEYLSIVKLMGLIDRDLVYFSFETYEYLKSLLANNVFRIAANNSNDNVAFGGGVFLTASLINHSCMANLEWKVRPDDASDKSSTQRRNWIHLTARKAIKVGEELSISYIPFDQDVNQRAEWLLQYGFECECGLCLYQRDMERQARPQGNSKTSSIDIKQPVVLG